MSTQYIPPQGPLAPAVNQPLVVQTLGYQQQQGSACGRVQERWQARPVFLMGVILLVIGVICIALNIAEIVMHAERGLVSHGIWCGILYIITGAFAIIAGCRKTLCFIVTCMVLSIISAGFAVPVIAVSIVGLVHEKTNWHFHMYATPDPSCCSHDYDDYGYRIGDESCCYYYEDYYDTSTVPAREALHGLMLVMGVVQGILAICTAVCCCQAVGCCAKPQAGSSVAGPQVGQAMQLIVVQGTSGYPQAVPMNTHGVVYNSPQPTGQQMQGVYQSGQPQQQPVQPVPPPAYTTQQIQPVENAPPPAYQNQTAPGTMPEQKTA